MEEVDRRREVGGDGDTWPPLRRQQKDRRSRERLPQKQIEGLLGSETQNAFEGQHAQPEREKPSGARRRPGLDSPASGEEVAHGEERETEEKSVSEQIFLLSNCEQVIAACVLKRKADREKPRRQAQEISAREVSERVENRPRAEQGGQIPEVPVARQQGFGRRPPPRRAARVGRLVLPAVRARDFDSVRELAHAEGLAYALGLHPLYVHEAGPHDLDRLAQALREHHDDPRLVAVGEIGLDHFVPGLDRALQERFYLAQLRLAREAGLPVILHVRRSADALLAGLARFEVPGGIAHAFNGSAQQARRFAERGFRLGFGGAMTFERALQIRALAAGLPDQVPVLETDAPDIPPWWLYAPAAERAAGAPQGRNEPAELPRIGQTLALLRGWSLEETAARTTANALAALPRMAAL